MTIAAKFSSAIERPINTSAALRIVQATIGWTKNLRNTNKAVNRPIVPSE
jgi:hypothetical protein